MKNAIIFILSIMLTACATKEQDNQELAKRILADQSMQRVDKMARDLMKKGFYAGSGYQMVWARDLNTFIELSCEEYDLKVLRENLLMFFHFQQKTVNCWMDMYPERVSTGRTQTPMNRLQHLIT